MGIPYALLTLGAVTAFVVFWTLNQAWIHTFGVFFQWLGHLGIDFDLPVGGHVGVHPFTKLLDLNNSIQTFLSTHVASTEHAMVRLFHQTVSAFGAFAGELGALAEGVERRFVSFAAASVPRLVKVAIGGLIALIRRIPALVRRVDNLIGYVERTIKAGIARAIAFTYGKVSHGIRAATGLVRDVIRRLTSAFHRIQRLEHWVFSKSGQKWLRRALKAAKLDWLFSTNLAPIVGMLIVQDFGVIREVTKDIVKFATTSDLCTLAMYNYDVAVYVFEPVMREVVAAEGWFCQAKNESLASAMDVKPEYKLAWAPSATPTIDFTILPERKAPHIPLPRGVVKA